MLETGRKLAADMMCGPPFCIGVIYWDFILGGITPDLNESCQSKNIGTARLSLHFVRTLAGISPLGVEE